MLRMDCCPSLQETRQKGQQVYCTEGDTQTVITPPVLLLSPVLLSFQQLPVGGDLDVQSQFHIHQVLQVKRMINLTYRGAFYYIIR